MNLFHKAKVFLRVDNVPPRQVRKQIEQAISEEATERILNKPFRGTTDSGHKFDITIHTINEGAGMQMDFLWEWK